MVLVGGLVGSLDNAGPAIHIIYKPIWAGLVRLKENGVKIRVVTDITNDNLSYCKKLMEVCELRHLNGLRTNFAVADGKQALLHGVSQETEPLSQAVLTSVKGLVEAQVYLFENLWKSAAPAEYKIKEIEEGVKPPFVETFRDPLEIQKLGFELLESANQEIQMLVLPSGSSTDTFLKKESEQIIVQSFKAATRQGTGVRILTTKEIHKQIEKLIEGLQQEKGNEDTGLVARTQGKFQIHMVDMLQQQQRHRLQSKVSFLIVDSKACLVEDLEVYNKNGSSNGTLSLATYSNSESTVLTYISIFETLWTQTEIATQRL